jgi:hypothetical protein
MNKTILLIYVFPVHFSTNINRFFQKNRRTETKNNIALCRARKTEPEKNAFFPGKKENPAKISGGPDD